MPSGHKLDSHWPYMGHVSSMVIIMWPAPHHHQNQCCNIVNSSIRNKLQWNCKRNPYISFQENTFENTICEMAVVLPRPQCSNQNRINGWFGTEAFADIRLGSFCTYARINVCMRLANGRRRYNVTSSLIGWARTQNYHCLGLCYLTGFGFPDFLYQAHDTQYERQTQYCISYFIYISSVDKSVTHRWLLFGELNLFI